MEKTKNNLSKGAVQSLGWTLLIVVAEIVVYVSVIVKGLVEPDLMFGSYGFFIYSLVNAICCFFIVKYKPISILFVPLIINVFLLGMAFFNTSFRIDPWWSPVVGGWILCLSASIVGVILRKRNRGSNIQIQSA